MSRDIKKLLAIGAVALFGIGLTACSAEDPDTDADTEVGGSAEEGEDAGAAADGTSPDAPLPAGSEIAIEDWTLTVTGVTLDATEEILAHNEFNDAPAEGSQQALVTIEGTYNGDETGSFWLDVSLGIYAGDTLYSSTDCLNTVEGDLYEAADVTAGGTATGSTCVEFPSAEADNALVYFEDIWALDGTVYYVEI